jgi:hypothetical protein
VSLPFPPHGNTMKINGKPVAVAATENAMRTLLTLRQAGDYAFTAGQGDTP